MYSTGHSSRIRINLAAKLQTMGLMNQVQEVIGKKRTIPYYLRAWKAYVPLGITVNNPTKRLHLTVVLYLVALFLAVEFSLVSTNFIPRVLSVQGRNSVSVQSVGKLPGM